jgi:hypothetical protein
MRHPGWATRSSHDTETHDGFYHATRKKITLALSHWSPGRPDRLHVSAEECCLCLLRERSSATVLW